MIECVYMILNKTNYKMYIGSTVNFEKRKRSHLNGLRGKYHENRLLQKDYDEFGESSFVFKVLCKSKYEEERFSIEESIIKTLKTYENGYNLTIDGRGKYIISEETREKMRRNSLGKNNPFYGRNHSDESLKRMSEIASLRVGDKNPFYGKTHSEESINKMIKSKRRLVESGWVNPQKGVPKSKEAVYNNMLAQPKRKPVHADGKVYPSISECARSLGVVPTTVINRVKNPKFKNYYYLDK